MEPVKNLTKRELIEKANELGFLYEQKYHGCSQCILAVVQDLFGLDDSVFKAGSALSAGMCLTGTGPCGCLTGGLIAIGYLTGRERTNFDNIKLTRNSAKIGRVYIRKFQEEYGSYICHDIQKKIFGRSFNLLDPEDFSAFEEAGGHKDKCPAVVGKAAGWLAEIIFEQLEKI